MYIADGTSPAEKKETVTSERRKRVVKFYKLCEVLLLGSIIFVIIGLFSIPTLYYALLQPVVRGVISLSEYNKIVS